MTPIRLIAIVVLGSLVAVAVMLALCGIAFSWSNALVGLLCALAASGAVAIWVVMGRPPVEFFFSAREQAFYRALREGQKRDDETFCDAFYRDSGIPREIPIRLRARLESELGEDLAALRPETNFADIDELDLADLFDAMEDLFQIKLPRETWKTCDGTFQSLVLMVVGARAKVSV